MARAMMSAVLTTRPRNTRPSLDALFAPPASRVIIRPIHRWDLRSVAAALPAAPYRTHADDLDWQQMGAVTELVAWRGFAPVGAGFIHWRGPRDAAIAALLPDCPEIFRLEVRAEHRSHGIGAALVRALEALARSRGQARIGLGVGIANVRARRLYERLGYRPAQVPIYVDRCERPGPDGQTVISEERCIYMVKDLA